jgi:hypothetical protein
MELNALSCFCGMLGQPSTNIPFELAEITHPPVLNFFPAAFPRY